MGRTGVEAEATILWPPDAKNQSLVKILMLGFPPGSEGIESACNVEDLSSIPGLERCPGKENGNPLQYSCLENPMDGGAWWATVHRVTKSRTQLSVFTSLLKVNKGFFGQQFAQRPCSES